MPNNTWQKVRLGQIARITSGGTPSRNIDEYWNNGEIPWITTTAINFNTISSGTEFITQKGLKNSSAKIFPPGTILMAMYGQGVTRGRVAILKIEAATNQACAAILPHKENIETQFLFYFLSNEYEQIREMAHGGNQKNLNGELIKQIPIKLPSLPEQCKIAEILSTWDEAIDLTQQLIAAKQRRKKALMQQLLTGKVRFPGFEEEWEVIKLGALGKFLKGSGITKSELVENGLPCIRYGEIYTVHHDFIKEFHSFISDDSAKNSKPVYNGDLLFAGSGETLDEIGKCVAYIGEDEAYAGGDVIILRLSQGDPKFLGYLMNHTEVRRQIYARGQGQSVVHIYSSHLKEITIKLPSLSEQRRIAAGLQACDEEIDLLQQKLAALQIQKKGLMQQLLTGQVRVRV